MLSAIAVVSHCWRGIAYVLDTKMQVLFDGRSELDQLDRIFKLLGSPNERIWTGLNKLPNARKVCGHLHYPLLVMWHHDLC